MTMASRSLRELTVPSVRCYDDAFGLGHVTPGGRGGLVRRALALASVHVRGVPVPPVMWWGDRLECAVTLRRFVQQICEGSDLHVSPPTLGGPTTRRGRAAQS